MVSPLYKGGYGVQHIEGVRQDGNAVAFFSQGTFEGAPAGFSEGLDGVTYLAHREESTWSTVPLMPPDALSSSVLGLADFFSTLDREIVPVQLNNLEDPTLQGNRIEFLSHSTTAPDVSANWQRLGVTLETLKKEAFTIAYRGASSDFCHLVFENQKEVGEEGHLLVGAKKASQPLYELVTGCNGEPAEVRLVALNDNQKLFSPECISELGIEDGSETGPSQFNAMANEGNEIFFSTCVAGNVLDHQLFVRLGGARTLEVSKPLKSLQETCGESEIPCKSAATRAKADFAGASKDGSRVFFTTTAPLTGESGDTSRSLYEATIGCRETELGCPPAKRAVTSLTRVSHTIAGGQGGVQGVARIAPDGSRVYFVARGALTETASVQGVTAVNGADNLYMYERDTLYPAGHIVFVADLCSGSDLSGEVEDVHCPNTVATDTSLWSLSKDAEAQTAGEDGRYLVFSSYGQLVRSDTDAARDIYRYDSRTGALDRVSGGEAGYHNDGNDSAFDATLRPGHRGESVSFQYEMNNRAISEDGSRIVFTTSEPLSPRAINGLSDVYEWHQESGPGEGEVSLVSSGSGETPITEPVISPEGSDVFYVTTQSLVRADTDSLADVYDARIGGGFPEPPAPRLECSSDACQGSLTNPAPLLVPGSVSQAPGGNFAAAKVTSKPKKRSKHKTKKQKKRTTHRHTAKHARLNGTRASRVTEGGR